MLATVPVLCLVTLGVFLLIHLVPGDPVEAMLGESQDSVAKETLRHTGARGIASAVESKADFGASEKPRLRGTGCEVPRHKSFLHGAPADPSMDPAAESRVLNMWNTERHPLG